MRANLIAVLTLVMTLLALPLPTTSAQVLIWSLPKEDGTWVRFEGTYKQTRARANVAAGDEMLEWRGELTISAVGSETAEIDGTDDAGKAIKKEVPCRWVEFKSITKPSGLDKQPGPGDTFVYKVLIPEEAVIGETTDKDGIPVTFLPIVKGWRKVGQRDAQAVTEKALAVYPTISLVTYYPNLKAEGDESEQVQVAGEAVAARLYKGSRLFKSTTSRSTNAAVLWRSDAVPFGLARFQVTLTQERKELAASADEFKQATLIDVDMAVVATGNDARSELGDADAK
ncbi:MAG: hypothetical protein ACM3U2_04720 [Deltaproteobacteria bacterium]